MDYGSLIIIIGIVIWCGFEYHKREQLHKERMANLKQGIELSPSSNSPSLLHIWTTGGLAIVLLVALIMIIITALKANPQDSLGYLFVIVPFLVLLIVLIIVMRNDINSYRKMKKD
ncbi:MAG: hypothetical protein EHM64_09270 [Ignavibacteriae bacterium]|nr:MAG: hypothetical protein EHM64_09270 [Ignavibacteriota bacterium]